MNISQQSVSPAAELFLFPATAAALLFHVRRVVWLLLE